MYIHIPTLKKRFSFSLITSCPFSFQMRPNLHIQKTKPYRDVAKGKRLRQKKGNDVCKRHDASVYSLFCRRRNNQVQNNGRDSQGSYEDLFATTDFNKSAIVSLCNANVEYDVSSTSTTLLSSLQLRRYSSRTWLCAIICVCVSVFKSISIWWFLPHPQQQQQRMQQNQQYPPPPSTQNPPPHNPPCNCGAPSPEPRRPARGSVWLGMPLEKVVKEWSTQLSTTRVHNTIVLLWQSKW